MTTPLLRIHGSLAMLAGLMVSATSVMAGQVVISNFDDEAATLWAWESWSDSASTEFDATLDAGGSTGKGSMRVINDFSDKPTGYSQAVVSLDLGQNVNAELLYTNLSFDIKLDPASYPRVNGTEYGGIEMVLRNGAESDWNSLGYYELTAVNTNWTHLNFPVKVPADAVHHLTLKLGQNNLTNTVIYNVDNIRWDETPLDATPPVMSIERTKAGLNCQATSGGQYDRQGIATAVSSFGWIGSQAPMSYSMTLTKFPSAETYAGYSAHFYFVPGTPGNQESPDWTEPTCIIVYIFANTNGTATSTFHYKTNAPNSNGIDNQYFNSDPANGPVGQIGSVTGVGVLGTWTVTFNNDTNITLAAPDGKTANMVMPPEDAIQFAGDVKVYFGIVPRETKNIGQTAVIGRIQINRGLKTLVDDSFSASPLNPDLWVVRAASPAAVKIITASEPCYVLWTTPASEFALRFSLDLKDPNWTDPGLTDELVGTMRRVLVPLTALPAASQGFFRLMKVE